YVLDMAEIPTFQARQAVDTDHDGTVTTAEAATWRDRECPRLARDLRATADGRALPLGVTGSALSFPKGAAGLATLRLDCARSATRPPGPRPPPPRAPPGLETPRLECALPAPLPAAQAASRSLTYADNTQPGR